MSQRALLRPSRRTASLVNHNVIQLFFPGELGGVLVAAPETVKVCVVAPRFYGSNRVRWQTVVVTRVGLHITFLSKVEWLPQKACAVASGQLASGIGRGTLSCASKL